MDAEEQLDEQQYLENFNNGYLLAKYEPELASKLFAKPNAEHPYFSAMEAGSKQYEAETKDWINKYTKGRQFNSNNDLNKGKDNQTKKH